MAIAHIYTQYIEQHIIDIKQYTEQYNSLIRKSADRALSLRVISWAFGLQLMKKHGKTSGQGSRRVPVGKMKTEYTEQNTECRRHQKIKVLISLLYIV